MDWMDWVHGYLAAMRHYSALDRLDPEWTRADRIAVIDTIVAAFAAFVSVFVGIAAVITARSAAKAATAANELSKLQFLASERSLLLDKWVVVSRDCAQFTTDNQGVIKGVISNIENDLIMPENETAQNELLKKSNRILVQFLERGGHYQMELSRRAGVLGLQVRALSGVEDIIVVKDELIALEALMKRYASYLRADGHLVRMFVQTKGEHYNEFPPLV